MKFLLLALILSVCGCGFAKWMVTTGEDGKTPVVEAVQEIKDGGPYPFNDPVAWVALALTAGKTVLRYVEKYRQVKKTEAVLIAKATNALP